MSHRFVLIISLLFLLCGTGVAQAQDHSPHFREIQLYWPYADTPIIRPRYDELQLVVDKPYCAATGRPEEEERVRTWTVPARVRYSDGHESIAQAQCFDKYGKDLKEMERSPSLKGAQQGICVLAAEAGVKLTCDITEHICEVAGAAAPAACGAVVGVCTAVEVFLPFLAHTFNSCEPKSSETGPHSEFDTFPASTVVHENEWVSFPVVVVDDQLNIGVELPGHQETPEPEEPEVLSPPPCPCLPEEPCPCVPADPVGETPM